jgi:hypothetical protein
MYDVMGLYPIGDRIFYNQGQYTSVFAMNAMFERMAAEQNSNGGGGNNTQIIGNTDEKKSVYINGVYAGEFTFIDDNHFINADGEVVNVHDVSNKILESNKNSSKYWFFTYLGDKTNNKRNTDITNNLDNISVVGVKVQYSDNRISPSTFSVVAAALYDVYNTAIHDHQNYITNKGNLRPIIQKTMSQNARMAASCSKNIKLVGTIGSAIMTGIAINNIFSNNPNVLDYTDAGVGVVGTTIGALDWFGVSVSPLFGGLVLFYSTVRLGMDLHPISNSLTIPQATMVGQNYGKKLNF